MKGAGEGRDGRAELEPLLERARGGEAAALEELVRAIQGHVYNLAVRMLWAPEDAEDATQEILIRVITNLGSFRGESALRTWVYRVAVNHLLNVRKSRIEARDLSFEAFGAALEHGLSMGAAMAPVPPAPDEAVMLEELKIGCTQAMLLCVPRDERVAFILTEVFRLSGREGAAVLEITPPAFRKRASRARERLRAFMGAHCGLVGEGAPCRCERWLPAAVASGVVRADRLQFAGRGAPVAAAAAARHAGEWDELARMSGVYRSHPRYPAPDGPVEGVRELLKTRAYRLLN